MNDLHESRRRAGAADPAFGDPKLGEKKANVKRKSFALCPCVSLSVRAACLHEHAMRRHQTRTHSGGGFEERLQRILPAAETATTVRRVSFGQRPTRERLASL